MALQRPLAQVETASRPKLAATWAPVWPSTMSSSAREEASLLTHCQHAMPYERLRHYDTTTLRTQACAGGQAGECPMIAIVQPREAILGGTVTE
jgi:hypothetical protein